MQTSRPLVAVLLIGILGAVGSGCASGGSGGGAVPPSLEGTSNSSASSPTDPPHSSVRPTSATEKLLLPEQVQLQEGGDGLGPICSTDGEFPDGFSRDPGIWLNNLYSPTEYPYIVVLCLRGFRHGRLHSDDPRHAEIRRARGQLGSRVRGGAVDQTLR
jgi:hypothetical protein